jgi:putative effector of murein hydrolase LrgA (UPF0299 family)
MMSVLNSQYNKATYTTLAGAVTTILFYVLAQYDIRPGPEVAAAVTTIVTALMTFFVPNKVG